MVSSKSEIRLTARELDVLKLVAKGKTNTQIAEELIISSHTAKAHVCRVLQKMEVKERLSAVILGLKLGILNFDLI